MDTKKIIDLLGHYDAFEKQTATDKLPSFARWLHQSLNGRALVESKQRKDTQNNRDLGNLLVRFHRFSRFYTKLVFQDLPINTIEEYHFLDFVGQTDNPSKSEVYDSNIIELTTGTKILKRLVDNGLLEETIDESDRRVRRVKISEKGEDVRNLAHQRLGEAANLEFGDIDKQDRDTMLSIFAKLDKFHSEIYKEAEEFGVKPTADKYLIKGK